MSLGASASAEWRSCHAPEMRSPTIAGGTGGALEIPSGVSSGLHSGKVKSLENSLEATHANDSRSNSSTDR